MGDTDIVREPKGGVPVALTRALKDKLPVMLIVAEAEMVTGEGPWVTDGVSLGEPD